MAFGTFKSKNILLTAITFLLIVPQLIMAQGVWDGGGADNNWSTALNWDDDLVPNGIAVSIGDGFTTVVDAGFTNSITSLTIGGGASGSVSLSTDLISTGVITVNAGATYDCNGNASIGESDLIINSAGTVSFGESIEHVVAALTVSGTADFESSTISVNNTLTINSGATFTAGTSTITINNGGTGIITSAINAAFNNLILDTQAIGGSGLTFDEVGDVNPVYTINGTFTIQNHPSTSTPVTTSNGATISYGGSSTLSYQETGTKTVGDEWPSTSSPDNVIIASAVIRTLDTAVPTVSGDVTVTGTLTLADNRDLTVAGLITVNGGTFNANSTTNPNVVNANGGLTVSSGTMDASNGDVNIADGQTLTLSGGTLDVSSGTLDILGGATLAKGGGTLTLGTLTYGATATLQYTASTTATGEWLTTVPNVTINSGVTTTVNSGAARTISNNLTLSGSGNLTYALANLLTVSGNLSLGSGTLSFSNASGTLTVTGTSVLGSGSTVSSAGGAITLVDNVTVNHLAKVSTSGSATLEGDLTVSGDGDIGATGSGTLVMGGTSTTTVNIDGSLAVNDFTVNKTGGSSTVVTPSSSVDLKFNTNGVLYVQQGILQMTSSSDFLNSSGVQISSGDNITLQIDATGTLRTADVKVTGFNVFTLADNSTLEFTGTGAQDIPSATYGNITVSTTHSSGATAIGALTFQDNSTVTVSASSRLNLGGQTITNAGISDALTLASGSTLYTDGSSLDGFTTNTMSGTVHFNGATAETTPSTAFVVNNVVLNNGAGLVVGTGDMTVTGTLTFTNGKITSTSADLLTLGVVATATPTSSNFVVGPVARQTNGVATSFAFPVGNGSNLRNVTLVFNGTVPANSETITIEANGTATGATSSDPDVNSVYDDGYWTASTSEATPPTNFTATLVTTNFTPQITASVSGTVVLGATPNFDTEGSSASTITDQVTATFASTSLSGGVDLGVGVTASTITWNGNTNLNWSEPLNWNGGVAPIAGDNVIINDGDAVVYDASVSTTSYNSISLSGNSSLTLTGATIDLSSGSMTVASGSGLTFNGTTISGYNQSNTDYQTGSTVTYNTGTILGDTYDGLTVNASLSTNADITVEGVLTLSSAVITPGANIVIIGTGGSVSGADASNYVSGKVRKVWAASTSGATFAFPVGKGGEYLPVTLGNISVNAVGSYDRTVELINSSAAGLDPDLDASLSRVSLVRYWVVDVKTGTGSLAAIPTVTLTWNSNDGVDGTISEIDVAQLSAGTWSSLGGTGTGTSSDGSVTSTLTPTADINFAIGDDAAGNNDNSLPVELASFKANPELDKVSLLWVTSSETDNFGFNVYKKISEEGEWTKLNEEIISGQGNTSAETGYEFVDYSVRSGDIYSYQLESVSISGVVKVEEVIEIEVPIPDKFVLFNNYPNPFNPVTNLKFQLPQQSKVNLVVYDITGRVVKTVLNDASYDVGQHTVSWDATNLSGAKVSSGMYVYRFSAGKYSKIGRMILVK